MRLGRLRFESKYLAIQYYYEHKSWSIRWMCRKLGITRAAYYKWLHREIPAEELENRVLAQLIQEYDQRFGHILGRKRMCRWINALNHRHYNVKRVHRLMNELNIHSVIRRKQKKYRHSTPETTAENLLARDFYAEAPNLKWVTDVTEFKWYQSNKVQKLYLSAILDLYDRSVVSWVIRGRNDNKLVLDTFQKAIQANPEAKPLFHSDRGFQYTSKVFQMNLEQQGMVQSMSRVGHCIDNGPAEGFWGIVKSEMYYNRKFTDADSLRKAISDYIAFYNNERLQERFGDKPPAQVRAEAFAAGKPAQYPIAPNRRIAKYKAQFAA
ncbi:MAG: IS3 family transposase [Candidatus Limivicinus sp.]